MRKMIKRNKTRLLCWGDNECSIVGKGTGCVSRALELQTTKFLPF